MDPVKGNISKSEYNKLWQEYRITEWNKIKDNVNRPNGMFGVWGWHLQKEKEFKKILNSQGIKVDKSLC